MRKTKVDENGPVCADLSCEMNLDGKCTILRDTFFKNKSCPFRKDREVAAKEKAPQSG